MFPQIKTYCYYINYKKQCHAISSAPQSFYDQRLAIMNKFIVVLIWGAPQAFGSNLVWIHMITWGLELFSYGQRLKNAVFVRYVLKVLGII